MNNKKSLAIGGVTFVIFALLATSALGQTYKVLHSFGASGDGWSSEAGLIADAQGNLYGTTQFGGPACAGYPGCGTVFQLTPAGNGSWNENILYSFTGGTDGYFPMAAVVFDSRGNLYGTTVFNTTNDNGVVFQLTPMGNGSWRESTLHTFVQSDGAQPRAQLTVDTNGHLYGTTFEGGTHGTGVVFDLGRASALSWYQLLLHSFGAHGDGYGSYSRLVPDASGNLYGTTSEGGPSHLGTVFKLTPNHNTPGWSETILHSFSGAFDGATPYQGVIFDTAGNLYGAATLGGSTNLGLIYKLTPNSDGSWTESVLYTFQGGSDQGHPFGDLVFDNAGNLYGTTQGSNQQTFGTIFKLTPSSGGQWTESALYTFQNGADGGYPNGALILDGAGNLYGTTAIGGPYGAEGGVAFEFTP